jgi:hypothetical protein
MSSKPTSPEGSAGAAPARAKKTTRTAATHARRTKAVEPALGAATSLPAREIEPMPATAAPTHDAIARLAYSFWLERNCEGGSPEEDWLRAERQLSARASTPEPLV